MAGSVNKVILLGNLGQDPDIRTMQSGKKVATMSIATSDSWKDKDTGQDQERTEWHRVVLWRRLAEIAGEYLNKGSKVYVEGQLRTRKWEQEGQTRYTTEIVARELQFLDSKNDAVSSQSRDSSAEEKKPSPEIEDSGIDDDEIPF